MNPRRTGAGYDKPSFLVLPKESTADLERFVGKDSFLFFKILKLETAFLHTPVSERFKDQSYLSAMGVVRHLCVVNDSAERGVKLCHDFLHMSAQESRLQSLLQVVKNNKKAVPNQRKRKIESKTWFIKL